jgi:hypothetical protein
VQQTVELDVKGDLSNLLLRCPDFSPAAFEPWVERERDDLPPEELARGAQELAERLARYHDALDVWSSSTAAGRTTELLRKSRASYGQRGQGTSATFRPKVLG